MRCHREGHLPGTRYTPSGKWADQLTVKGKRKHLGLFDTAQEAHEAYMAECRNIWSAQGEAA